MSDRSRYRSRFAIAMLTSVGIHAAVLAWAAVEVPVAEPARIELLRGRAPALEDPRPPIRVVEIRPPGVGRSPGGSTRAGGASTEAAAGSARTAAEPSRPPSTPAVSRVAPRSDPSPRLVAIAASPGGLRLPERLVALPERRDGEAAPTTHRPARGVVLRASGDESGSAGEGAGEAGTGRLGGLGSGITIVGPGGDCITPGLTLPAGRELPARRPVFEPGRGRGSSSPTERPSKPKRP